MADQPIDVLRRNRKAALEAADGMGGRRLLRVLKASRDELAARLQNQPAGKGAFTATRLQLTLKQVEDVTKRLTKRLRSELVDQAEDTAEDAAQHVVDYMTRADRAFRGISSQGLRLKEASLFDRAIAGARSSMLRRLLSTGTPAAAPEDMSAPHPAKQGVLERYGVETVGSFEGVLQRAMVTGASWAEVRDGLVSESPFLQGQPRFWAERIARTETLSAHNRSSWESIRAADDQLGDMCKILSAVFDDRTGWDSYQVHGQIRLPDQAFEWEGGAYQAPPNRPNDREVVVPHRIAWPIPPYLEPKSDDAVMAAYRRQRKTGGPGARPVMSTVPRSRFGRG